MNPVAGTTQDFQKVPVEFWWNMACMARSILFLAWSE